MDLQQTADSATPFILQHWKWFAYPLIIALTFLGGHVNGCRAEGPVQYAAGVDVGFKKGQESIKCDNGSHYRRTTPPKNAEK